MRAEELEWDDVRGQDRTVVGAELLRLICEGGMRAISDACGEDDHCWMGVANDCEHPAKGWVGASRTVPPAPPAPPPGLPCNVAACEPSYDDSAWRDVALPHDFVVENNFTNIADKAHGYLPFAAGWYRHHFTLPAVAAGGQATVWLEFDGVQRNSVAYLNGKFLCSHLSGYTPFRCAIASGLGVFDGRTRNVLAIHVDATRPDGWWYDGGGIYRHLGLCPAFRRFGTRHCYLWINLYYFNFC